MACVPGTQREGRFRYNYAPHGKQQIDSLVGKSHAMPVDLISFVVMISH